MKPRQVSQKLRDFLSFGTDAGGGRAGLPEDRHGATAAVNGHAHGRCGPPWRARGHSFKTTSLSAHASPPAAGGVPGSWVARETAVWQTLSRTGRRNACNACGRTRGPGKVVNRSCRLLKGCVAKGLKSHARGRHRLAGRSDLNAAHAAWPPAPPIRSRPCACGPLRGRARADSRQPSTRR